MTNDPQSPALESLEELLAHAWAIELDAVARYTELAGQMETHNNPELALMFAKLAKVEQLHADQIGEKAKEFALPQVSPWNYRWPGAESPESIDLGRAHYLMTPWHALTLALRGEEAARDFFEDLARAAPDPKIKALAEEFAEDERDHVRLMEDWLAHYPEPEAGWDDDPDPPEYQE